LQKLNPGEVCIYISSLSLSLKIQGLRILGPIQGFKDSGVLERNPVLSKLPRSHQALHHHHLQLHSFISVYFAKISSYLPNACLKSRRNPGPFLRVLWCHWIFSNNLYTTSSKQPKTLQLVSVQHCAKTLCLLQQLKAFIDLGEWQIVSDIVIQIDGLKFQPKNIIRSLNL